MGGRGEGVREGRIQESKEGGWDGEGEGRIWKCGTALAATFLSTYNCMIK